MALTIDSGQQAGVLAAQGLALQDAIAQIQGALAAVPAVQIESINATSTVGEMVGGIMLNAADSTTMLNAILTIYQNMLTNINTQLAAM